ncbi:GFA family protein [Afipia sp. GAS231]|uniref:GFA family protein n=1 Tax=Afipia sp. GAS231 TaxID=1882747 RepID=UPI001FCD9CF2|nr:GFA family protein [Afipia sp. GAS231]
MVFPRAALAVTGVVTETLRTADSGEQKLKGFCGSCGSPLDNKPLSKPDMLGVYVGTLDDPSDFKPDLVMFASRGHAWDHLDPALPKIPNMRPSK